jgi:hypothetical protein
VLYQDLETLLVLDGVVNMPRKPIEQPREICNKKVSMTEYEYEEYKQLCRSYDTPYRKGETLFLDLFETNDNGRVIYIKSLGNRQSSLEIILFLLSLMQNQWLRAITGEVNNELKKIRAKNKILDNKIKEVDEQLKILKDKK